ncbi:MAG: O-antigen ligase family protein, partial [Planctomycetota bacterium JB042]
MTVVLLFWLVTLFVEPMAFEQPHLKVGVLLGVGSLLLLPSAWAGSLRRAAAAPLPGPLVAFSAVFAVSLIATALGPPHLPAAIRATATLLLLLLAAIAAHEDAWSFPLRIPRALLAAGAAIGGLAIAQKAGVDFPFRDVDGADAAVATFGNTNLTGEFLAPLVALGAVLVAGARGADRFLAGAALVLSSAGVVASESRGAAVAALAGLVAAALFARGVAPGRVVGAPLLLGLAGGVGLAVAAGGPGVLGFKAIDEADASIVSIEYPTNAQRLLLARAAFEMGKDAPLVGHGPGSFRSVFPPYRDPGEATIETLAGAPSEAEDPHDQYLLLWTEGGVLALLPFLLFLLPALFAFRHAAVLPPDDPRRVVGPALAAALATLTVAMLFRSSLAHPPTALLVVLTAGALLPFRDAADGRGGREGSAWGRIVPLYLVVTAVVGLRMLAGDLALAQGVRAGERAVEQGDPSHLAAMNDWLRFAALADDANLGLLQFSAARAEQRAETSPEARAEAIERRERILALHPFHRDSLLRLAWLSLLEDDVDGARALLRRALAVRRADDPDGEAALLATTRFAPYAVRLLADDVEDGRASLDDLRALADAAESKGDRLSAALALATIVRFRPTDADSAFRAAELFRDLGRPEMADVLFAEAQLAYGIVHLGGRDHAAARRAAAASRRHAPSLKADVLAALADYADGDETPFRNLLPTARAKLDPTFVAALRM